MENTDRFTPFFDFRCGEGGLNRSQYNYEKPVLGGRIVVPKIPEADVEVGLLWVEVVRFVMAGICCPCPAVVVDHGPLTSCTSCIVGGEGGREGRRGGGGERRGEKGGGRRMK